MVEDVCRSGALRTQDGPVKERGEGADGHWLRLRSRMPHGAGTRLAYALYDTALALTSCALCAS